MDEPRPFLGMFFLTFNDFQRTVFQGQVMTPLPNDCFLCDYFSWTMGEWTYSKVHHVDEFKEFKFFENVTHLNQYCEKRNAP
jgi:hypothetical protein